MSDRSSSNKDEGTLNSDSFDRDVTADQQLEGHIQDIEDRGLMLTDDDEDSAGPDAAKGVGRGYRATAGVPDIGESDSPDSDRD